MDQDEALLRDSAPTATRNVSGTTTESTRSSTRRRRRRRIAPSPKETRRFAVVSMFVVVLAGAVAALGSVHATWVFVFSTLAIATGTLAVYQNPAPLRSLPRPAWVFFGLATYSAVQAASLPFSWVQALSPAAADVWVQANLLVRGQPPSWASLSVDPGASLTEALKWFAYAATFQAAASITRSHGRRRIPTIIFYTAVVVALVTLAHGLVDAKAVYGVYQPLAPRNTWALSPLLNPNNLAAYLNLGFFCGLGMVLSSNSRSARLAVGTLAATLAAISIMTGSRAGATALILGVSVLVLLLSWPAHGRSATHGRLTSIAQVGAAAAGAVLLFLAGATPLVWRQLLDETGQKLRIQSWTQPMISDHFWFGVGRGAFETSFPPYREGGGGVVFQYAENFLVQWIVEWGIVVAALSVLSLAWMLRPSRLGVGTSRLASAAVVGVAVVLVHNLLDLGLEVLGVGLAIAATLGSLWEQGTPREGHAKLGQNDPRGSSSQFPAAALLLAGSGVLACGAVAIWDMRPVLWERNNLQEQLESSESGALEAAIHAAILRHPGDSYLFMLAALVAERRGENPLPWVGRAIERDPQAGKPYMLLARLLAEHAQDDQSRLSIRMALGRDPELVANAAPLLLRVSRTSQEILSATPEGETGDRLILAVARQLPWSGSATNRLSFMDEATRLRARSQIVRAGATRDLLAAIERGHGRCRENKQSCGRSAHRHLTALGHLVPQDASLPLYQAHLLVLERRFEQAEDRLAVMCPDQPRSVYCWTLRLKAAHGAKRSLALDEAESGLISAACPYGGDCANAARTAAGIRRARGEWLRAAELYELAASHRNSGQDWLTAADMALRAGDPRGAEASLKKAAAAGTPASKALIDRLAKVRRSILLHGISEETH